MTGMTVAKRGCHGYTVEPGTPIMEAAKLWDPDELLAGPRHRRLRRRREPGPRRLRPRHHRAPAPAPLPQPLQARRGADLLLLHPLPPLPLRGAGDRSPAPCSSTTRRSPRRAPRCVEVVTVAKRDLKAGEVIDELGGYLAYGECEDAAETAKTATCRSASPSARSSSATSPRTPSSPTTTSSSRAGRLVDRYRAEQDALFAAPAPAPVGLRGPTMARIRFAIVGTGYVADNYMFSARQYPETVEIVRAFDIVPAHAERFRQDLGHPDGDDARGLPRRPRRRHGHQPDQPRVPRRGLDRLPRGRLPGLFREAAGDGVPRRREARGAGGGKGPDPLRRPLQPPRRGGAGDPADAGPGPHRQARPRLCRGRRRPHRPRPRPPLEERLRARPGRARTSSRSAAPSSTSATT